MVGRLSVHKNPNQLQKSEKQERRWEKQLQVGAWGLSFSNSSVCTNPPGTLFKYRPWFSRSGAGLQSAFLTRSQVMTLHCWPPDHALSGKDSGLLGHSKNSAFTMSEMGSLGGFRAEGMWDRSFSPGWLSCLDVIDWEIPESWRVHNRAVNFYFRPDRTMENNRQILSSSFYKSWDVSAPKNGGRS